MHLPGFNTSLTHPAARLLTHPVSSSVASHYRAMAGSRESTMFPLPSCPTFFTRLGYHMLSQFAENSCSAQMISVKEWVTSPWIWYSSNYLIDFAHLQVKPTGGMLRHKSVPPLPSSTLWPIFRVGVKCFSIYRTATFLPILTSVQHGCYLWETLTLALYILNENKSNQFLFSKQWWHLRSHIVQYYWYALIIFFSFTFLLVS